MKDIILPSETSDAIDLGAIDEDTEGIVISYKGDDAVGYITCVYGECMPWSLYNTIDNTTVVKDIKGSHYTEDTLINLVNRLVKDKVADSFKLINFTIDLDNYNPDKLSSDTKKLMNKKGVWSL